MTAGIEAAEARSELGIAGTEGVKILLELAFAEAEAERVVAQIDDNVRSSSSHAQFCQTRPQQYLAHSQGPDWVALTGHNP